MLISAWLLLMAMDGTAAPSPARDVEESGWSPIQSDFPFQISVLGAPFPEGNTTYKSVSMRLGGDAAMSFDTDLLRMSAGWTGKFLTATGVAFDTSHGGHPNVAGDQKFGTARAPGWADRRGRFTDPRKVPYGPLPATWARWDGLHVVGNDLVAEYTVHGTKVFEQPSSAKVGGITTFVRTFRMDHIKTKLRLLVVDAGEKPEPTDAAFGPNAATASPAKDTLEAVHVSGARSTRVMVTSPPPGTTLRTSRLGRIVLDLPPTTKPALFKVMIAVAPEGAKPDLAGATAPARIADFNKGGTRHWPQVIETRGVVSKAKAPYVVDRLTTPFPGVYKGEPPDWKDNIFHRRIMIGGFDFFSDGKRAALSTWEGDVWIAEDIDANLEHLKWHRYASGLFEPLGLKIVDDIVYVSGRDQITRLFDTNGDGEADFYENFNNQVAHSSGFHEFQFDLQTDQQGNFYTAKAGPVRAGGSGFGGGGGNGVVTPFSGTVQKVSKDGKTREIIASGFRAPNGIGVSPTGQVTTGDNEGTWVPASPINWVRKGGFYGVQSLAHTLKAPKTDPPLCWIAKSYDNSGGGQTWVESDKWGPFKGELLHLSYGRASVYLVMKQKVGGQMQGGIVRLAGGDDASQMTGPGVKLTSSAMRARWNPADGQLYVAGLSGWQTDAVSLTGFDRIRYTGAPVATVRGIEVTQAGVKLTFSGKLDPASADAQNFSGERWNYHRTGAYGSPEFSLEDPARRGHDRLEIAAATLSGDGKTVTLQVGDLRPANQMLLKINVKTGDGTPIKQTVMHTIHKIAPDPTAKKLNLVAAKTKPGLLLRLSGASGVAATRASTADARVVDGISLFVAHGGTPSPLVAPGAFEASWQGTLTPELRGTYLIAGDAAGSIHIEVAGKTLIDENASNGRFTSQPFVLDKAPNPLHVVLRGPGSAGSYLRLEWALVPGAQERAAGAKPLFEPIRTASLRHDPSGDVASAAELRLGRKLFLEGRCARCHVAPADGQGGGPEFFMDAPKLDGIGSRRNWNWLKSWVRDPRGERAGTRMPRLLKGDRATTGKDADAIAAYLATLTDPALEKAKSVERRAGAQTSEGARLITDLHCEACHNLQAEAADDGRESLDRVGRKFPAGALADFLEKPERHHSWIEMPNFGLTHAEAVALETELRMHAAQPSPVPAPVPAEKPAVARGAELIRTLGCLSCHQMGSGPPAPVKIHPLPSSTRAAADCIEGTGPADYGFGDAGKKALRAFIARAWGSLLRHAPSEFAERQLVDTRCGNCHGRFDDIPLLDNVGEKLRPEWMRDFVAGRVPWKPRALRHPNGHEWLAARMPAFASRAPWLAEGLAAAAGYAAQTPGEPVIDHELAGIGATLVSANGGFSCVACHGNGPAPATQVFEAEGINFAHIADRLRPDFFRRWLQNPTKIDSQTKMPAYFDASGSSPLDTILGGRAGRQIEALWQYMRLAGTNR